MTAARRFLLTATLLVAAQMAGTPAGARPLDDLQEGDALVQSVGWKLARANVRFCTRSAPAIGVLLGDVRTFNNPAAARDVYGLSGDIMVAAVAQDGPAARAQIDANDTITAIAGKPVDSEPPAPPGAWTRQIALQDTLETTVQGGGSVALTLGDGRTVNVAGEQACTVRFMLDDNKTYAQANRREVHIGRAYYESTRGDEAVFVAVVAHEMAHAVLDHQSVLDKGRTLSAVRRTEEEADRLSVWLMANAGYDPQSAVRLMQTVLRRQQFLSFDPSHGGWKTRARVIAAEIEAMKAAPDLDWSRYFRREI